jgi:cysteine desulfurase
LSELATIPREAKPMTEGIYLDNNAATMVVPEVAEAMLPFFAEQFGNPSSLHRFGDQVARAIKQARQQVQELFGAEHDSEIIFTACGTESDSTAAHGTIRFSLSRYNRTDEIETVVAAVPSEVAQLRRLSPDWGEQGPVQDPQKAFATTYA